MPQITPFSPLGNMPVDIFLRDYWQKKPLLIRQAFPHYQSPISPDELAGFALEEEITSRLIIETPSDNPLKSKWELEHGPLDELRFSSLPSSHWTLLVQNVDSFDEGANTLLDAFSFIPNWRLDDVMISYAEDQGSVGPHFDYYDVFLLQAHGKRHWKTGQMCDAHSALVADVPMQILTEFQQENEWLLEPGDMLYLPPQLAHWGIAKGECMTYSIGFRAPSHSDILLDFCQDVASKLNQDQRYKDSNLHNAQHPGEIDDSVIETLQGIIETFSQNKDLLAQWFGEYMSRPNAPMDIAPFDPLLFEQLEEVGIFRLSPYARAAFYRVSSNDSYLFVNNYSWSCSLALAKTLSEYADIKWSSLTNSDLDIIKELAELGVLVAYE